MQIMKKILSLIVLLALAFALCACGKTADGEEQPDDPAWERFRSLGRVVNVNGTELVSVDVSSQIVGTDVTQDILDANVGEGYTSAKLNEDGSVTFRLTKEQLRTMLDSIVQRMEEELKTLVENPDYAFTEITHNEDLTVFDVHLSTEKVGFMEGFMAPGFYLYGGIYATYSGNEGAVITVNYYGPDGSLISSVNSSKTAGG